ncbi:MAG: M15 family metallopeptidase [Streptosporangiaceae bacterium]
MPYWGFDGVAHPGGQMIVNKDSATKVAGVFRKLYAQKYPIRRMRLVDAYQGDDFDSIDDDNTSAFNCRQATGSGNWSQHAYGWAIDLNPCENPYIVTGGEIAHRKCAKFYRNRSAREPGVITRNDRVVKAFAAIGWGWGGNWDGNVKDTQHFSKSGR